MKFYISATGVLGLRTNANGLKWSWGIDMPEATEASYNGCAVRLSLLVDEEASRMPGQWDPSSVGKYHYFSGSEGIDEIYYRRTLLGRRNLYLCAKGLSGQSPTLIVNANYLRYVTHRFMNLHSPAYILTDIAALLLLKAGYAPVHCSAFRYAGKTALILAPPNTGKTLATMMACLHHGAEFIAEDLAITDGSRIYSVPWTSTFRYYDSVDTSFRSRSLNRMRERIPLIELFPLSKSQRVDSLLSRESLLDSAEVDSIFFLERGESEICTMSHGEAHRKAVNLNRYEFNYIKSPTLVAYEFFNPGLCLDKANDIEKSLLSNLLQDPRERVRVRVRDASHYAQAVIDYLTDH